MTLLEKFKLQTGTLNKTSHLLITAFASSTVESMMAFILGYLFRMSVAFL
jgi:hypothetical protein